MIKQEMKVQKDLNEEKNVAEATCRNALKTSSNIENHDSSFLGMFEE